MDITFTGKTALVTGAGKGIGRETAKLLAKCGANVIALTRTQSDLDSLKQEIPNLQTICVDLENIDEAVKAVEAAGDIDLLVNNAAYVVVKSCLAVTKQDIDRSMLVNVTAPIMLSQVVAKKLLERGKSGAIVNISSVTSLYGNLCPYVCVKSAVASATKCFAVELGPKKIRVNCVLPGWTKTPLVDGMLTSSNFDGFEEAWLARLPRKQMAEPEELAHTIVYLLSDKASNVTGQSIVSDGGYSVV